MHPSPLECSRKPVAQREVCDAGASFLTLDYSGEVNRSLEIGRTCHMFNAWM
jgi:hypothetical protein